MEWKDLPSELLETIADYSETTNPLHVDKQSFRITEKYREKKKKINLALRVALARPDLYTFKRYKAEFSAKDFKEFLSELVADPKFSSRSPPAGFPEFLVENLELRDYLVDEFGYDEIIGSKLLFLDSEYLLNQRTESGKFYWAIRLTSAYSPEDIAMLLERVPHYQWFRFVNYETFDPTPLIDQRYPIALMSYANIPYHLYDKFRTVIRMFLEAIPELIKTREFNPKAKLLNVDYGNRRHTVDLIIETGKRLQNDLSEVLRKVIETTPLTEHYLLADFIDTNGNLRESIDASIVKNWIETNKFGGYSPVLELLSNDPGKLIGRGPNTYVDYMVSYTRKKNPKIFKTLKRVLAEEALKGQRHQSPKIKLETLTIGSHKIEVFYDKNKETVMFDVDETYDVIENNYEWWFMNHQDGAPFLPYKQIVWGV